MKEAVGSFLQERAFRKRLARFLTHPVTLLAIATVFATLAGAWLTNYYQERAWVREKQFETFRQGYREALELVDELSEVMSRRVFGLNRVIWVAKGTGTGEDRSGTIDQGRGDRWGWDAATGSTRGGDPAGRPYSLPL